MAYDEPFSDFEGNAIATPRGESYDRSTYPAGWDDGIKAAVAERYPAKSDNQRVLDAFEEDWTKASNNYQGWLSVGVNPQEAAARTLQPQVAKWASFAPIMRNMTAQSRYRPEQDWKIVHAADGIFRVNQRTGEREVVHETKPKPNAFDFDGMDEIVPEVKPVEGRAAEKRALFGIDAPWADALWPDKAAVEAVAGHGKQTIHRKVPRVQAPQGAFDDSFSEGSQPKPQTQGREVTHKLKNGRTAIFDAATKRFIRYVNQ